MILLEITRRFETLGIDPLVGKNLWDNVSVSSPCIGRYKLTCLQNASVFSFISPAGFELSSVNPSGSCWSVSLGDSLVCDRLRFAPAWAVLGYSFVGFVAFLPGGCYYTAPS